MSYLIPARHHAPARAGLKVFTGERLPRSAVQTLEVRYCRRTGERACVWARAP